ncbi:AMP-binding protein, partial [Mucilaginibacter sp. RCC_168]|uniref:AMP-binding protein n=1 Tax=Mucilaginibacter sp. RCC_168 TaxID=3239221 RepID=UPI003524E8D7
MIEHKSITRLFDVTIPLYQFSDNDVWPMFHSFCFDFSVWEMFGALFYGGRLIIVNKDVVKDGILFTELLINQKVTILNQTPSAFYVLQNYINEKISFSSLKYVIFGGEALSPSKIHYTKELSESYQLFNMYGITEISVHATYQKIKLSHIYNLNIPIGRPIANTQIYILGPDQGLVPVGVTGE